MNDRPDWFPKNKAWWKYYPSIFRFDFLSFHVNIRKVVLLEFQYFPSRQVGYYQKICFLCFEITYPPDVPTKISTH